ncbi:MAG: hypothetical protein ACXWWE_00545, partial [Nitrospira sp.]
NDHDAGPLLGLRVFEPPAIALGVDMGRNDGRSVFYDPFSRKIKRCSWLWYNTDGNRQEPDQEQTN